MDCYPEAALPPPVVKLCKDCKYYASNRELNPALARCLSPQNPHTTNLVDGSDVYSLPYCSQLRTGVSEAGVTTCGIAGVWYEARPVHTPSPVPATSANQAGESSAVAAIRAKIRTKPGTNLLEDLGM